MCITYAVVVLGNMGELLPSSGIGNDIVQKSEIHVC